MKLQKKKDYTLNFSLLFLIHYACFSLTNSQRATFLIGLDYSLIQRSLIFAIVPLLTIISQFVIGYLSDRYQTIKKIMIWIIAIAAVSAYLFYSVKTQFYVFHFALGVISHSFFQSIMDLGDVWVLESKGKSSKRYGFIRAFGSAGWALGSLTLAAVVSRFGYQGVAVTSLLLNIVCMAIVVTIADDKAERAQKAQTESLKFKDIVELFTDKNYLLVIGIVFFMNMAKNMSTYMVLEKIIVLNGDVIIIAIREMIAAGAEVPIMLIGDKIHRKLGSVLMIAIGTGVFILQFIGFYMATSTAPLLFFTSFQMFSFTFYQVGMKYLLMDASPEHLKTTGQMSGPAIMNGITGFTYPLLAAFLVGRYTINTPFLYTIGFCIATLFILIIIQRDLKRAS